MKEDGWFKKKLKAATEWCKENKDILIVVVPATATIIAGGSKLIGKAIDSHNEHNHQTLTCYDRSLGHYWRLKRELDNQEWVEIERRRKNGEKLADILSEMKVLK